MVFELWGWTFRDADETKIEDFYDVWAVMAITHMDKAGKPARKEPPQIDFMRF